MNFEELIDGLGKAIGMELTVQDGLCGVKADGVPVVMRYIEAYAIVYIHADLGNPPRLIPIPQEPCCSWRTFYAII